MTRLRTGDNIESDRRLEAAHKAAELTLRVAMYRSRYGSLIVWEVGEDPDKHVMDGWVRVSEVLEITCTPLPPDSAGTSHNQD